MVWLKDSWRIDSRYHLKEVDVYERLRYHKVPHISGVVASGDVRKESPQKKRGKAQTTLTQDYVKKVWASEGPVLHKHVHYRIVLEKIGSPLKSFESTKQLCQVLLHALQGTSR